MSTSVYIFQESPVKLWGLTSRERLERVLAKAGINDFITDPAQAASANVLLLRADYLYDDRIIQSLLEAPDTVLLAAKAGRETPVAALVRRSLAEPVYRSLNESRLDEEVLDSLRTVTPRSLTSAYQQCLRKFDPPFVLPITEQYRHQLEKHLFSWSYKGITDLVTKWCWPLPARLAVGVCVRKGWKPNQVTLVGLGLVILAGILFYSGFFALGLTAGWIMTFLDTVDGKLARVTVTSSKFGPPASFYAQCRENYKSIISRRKSSMTKCKGYSSRMIVNYSYMTNHSCRSRWRGMQGLCSSISSMNYFALC